MVGSARAEEELDPQGGAEVPALLHEARSPGVQDEGRKAQRKDQRVNRKEWHLSHEQADHEQFIPLSCSCQGCHDSPPGLREPVRLEPDDSEGLRRGKRGESEQPTV